MGSKAKISKQILPIILAGRKEEQWYVEPFAGGMNSICEVAGPRLANDIDYYLIEMWKALVYGWIPEKITREKYYHIKDNVLEYHPAQVGWTGFNCSYSGKWFGGFAGDVKTKIGTTRDYQDEAIRNVCAQVKKMKGVTFRQGEYHELEIPPNSIIYCDPPYQGTTGYNNSIDYQKFWNWAREKSAEHILFVSEYSAPDDFQCVWQKEVKSSLSANGKSGGNKNSVEKLFKLKCPNY